jgi:hypothetical protein
MRYLLVALALAALLRVPGCFTQEEMKRWGLFQADEEQHMAIAVDRYNELAAGRDTIADPFEFRSFNVQGYGRTAAYPLYGYHVLTGRTPTFGVVVAVNRGLAVTFSLLLVLLTYLLGQRLGLSLRGAGIAAGLVACCDLLASYGHYGLPLSGYVFFVYLSVYGGVGLLRDPDWRGATWLALGAGGAVAFKFDVLPILATGLLLAGAPQRGYVLMAGVLALFAACLLTYGWGAEEIRFSFEELRRQNADVVAVDDHWRDNLIAYPMAVLAGIGLPAFCLAVWAAATLVGRHLRFSRWRHPGTLTLLYIGGLLLAEFTLLWALDTTFVRRAAVFMPAVALLAARRLHRLGAGRGWVAFVLIWSLGLALVGQYNHWFDTRYAFRDWARRELPPPAKIGTAGIAVDLPNRRYYESIPLDYFAIHESIGGRYERSLTTPFGIPECCEGVYHCGPLHRCRLVQDILLDRHASFQLVKTFRPLVVFPERLLYQYLFGYYETFLGYVRVYRRTAPQRGDYPLG